MFNLSLIEGKQIVTTMKWSFFVYQVTKTASDIIIATTIITWSCGECEETDRPL